MLLSFGTVSSSRSEARIIHQCKSADYHNTHMKPTTPKWQLLHDKSDRVYLNCPQFIYQLLNVTSISRKPNVCITPCETLCLSCISAFWTTLLSHVLSICVSLWANSSLTLTLLGQHGIVLVCRVIILI